MKLKYILLTIICCLIIIISNVFAARNVEENNDLFICGNESPQWFKDEVNIIAKNSSLFKPVKVFIIQCDEIEYIAIEDRCKNSTNKLKVFLCSGLQVGIDDSICSSLIQKYKNNEVRSIYPE